MIKSDVIVIGAGPAGSIAARQLGMAGLSVQLIDPLDRPHSHCIESFPPSGAHLADEIGLLQTICATSEGPASAINMRWRKEAERREFGEDAPLLFRKALLHKNLQAAAAPYVDFIKATVRSISAGDTEAVVF